MRVGGAVLEIELGDSHVLKTYHQATPPALKAFLKNWLCFQHEDLKQEDLKFESHKSHLARSHLKKEKNLGM